MSQPVADHRRRGSARFTRLALAGALIAGTTAFAPAAQADTLGSVRSHINAADMALRTVAVAAAGGGSTSGPLAELEAQLSAAGHASAKLYLHAHTPALRVRAATAMTRLAAQQNRDAARLTPFVGRLSGAGQADLAGFVAIASQGREQALTLASRLIGRLPASAQGRVAGIVAQLSSVSTGQVGELAGAISPGSVACPAIDAVSQVVATVITSVQADLARLQSLLAFLPAGAPGKLTALVNGLPAQLNALVASLRQGFSCPSSAPLSGQGPSASTGSLIGSVTQLVQSLLASFLPGVSAGQAPSPVTVPGPVSGLLSQVTTVIPALGGLLGGAPAGGLLGGLAGLGG